MRPVQPVQPRGVRQRFLDPTAPNPRSRELEIEGGAPGYEFRYLDQISQREIRQALETISLSDLAPTIPTFVRRRPILDIGLILDRLHVPYGQPDVLTGHRQGGRPVHPGDWRVPLNYPQRGGNLRPPTLGPFRRVPGCSRNDHVYLLEVALVQAIQQSRLARQAERRAAYDDDPDGSQRSWSGASARSQSPRREEEMAPARHRRGMDDLEARHESQLEDMRERHSMAVRRVNARWEAKHERTCEAFSHRERALRARISSILEQVRLARRDGREVAERELAALCRSFDRIAGPHQRNGSPSSSSGSPPRATRARSPSTDSLVRDTDVSPTVPTPQASGSQPVSQLRRRTDDGRQIELIPGIHFCQPDDGEILGSSPEGGRLAPAPVPQRRGSDAAEAAPASPEPDAGI